MAAYGYSDEKTGRGLLSCADVRRLTQGVLENMNMGMLTRTSLHQKAQELLLSTSDYWLSYAAAALIYWLLDDKQAAERALQKALNMDDSRTSLFFFLIMVREKRERGVEKWLERYLSEQDPLALSKSFVYLLNAYTAGLLEAAAGHQVSQCLTEWQHQQEEDPDVFEPVLDQWRDWFHHQQQNAPLKKDEQFAILKNTKHATAEELMRSSHLAEQTLAILRKIVQSRPEQREDRTEAGEYLYAFIDHDRSDNEQTPLQTFTYAALLTTCVLTPDDYEASAAVRQYGLASVKGWVRSAFDDAQAETVQKFPDAVNFYTELPGLPAPSDQKPRLDFSTRDGSNEREVLQALRERIQPWKQSELDKHRPGWEVFVLLFCIIGGGALLIFGGSWVITNHPFILLVLVALTFIGLTGLIAGLIITGILAFISSLIVQWLTELYVSHSTLCIAAVVVVLLFLVVRVYQQTLGKRRSVEGWFRTYTADKEAQICRCMAETADFYDFYTQNMAKQKELNAFLSGLHTTDFVRHRYASGRRIRI